MLNSQFCLTRKIWLLAIGFLVLTASWLPAQTVTDAPVSSTLMPSGRAIAPAGKLLTHYGRLVDMKLSHDGQTLFVKAHKELWIVDATTAQLRQTLPIPDGASLYGIATSKNDQVYVTNATHLLLVYAPAASNDHDNQVAYQLDRQIDLATDSFPCGIVLDEETNRAWICLSKKNSVAVVDLESGQVIHDIPVGVAPFDVGLIADGQIIVSNIGGRRPTEHDQTAPSGGTATVIDERGIANTGTVSLIDRETHEVTAEINVGLHPSTLCDAESFSVVCNTNEDTLSFIRKQDHLATEFIVKPDEDLPFGSMPSAVILSADQRRLFVAVAGNNAVCVVDLANAEKPQILGWIPTAWYPASLACNDKHLFVGNIKGTGSRAVLRDAQDGWNSHDHQGLVQQIALADILDSGKLQAWTETVHKNARIPQILRSNVNTEAEPTRSAQPVPERLGQPSVFQHVIYVVKENRTFDQVFGDLPEARSEPTLCVFPEKVSPNHHALARRFGILDNYYCNGVLSADGHSWATEGNVTPYLERAFGGFARSYTFGDDPITYSSSGFIWDRFLAAGLSFRNYGEMDYATPPEDMSYVDIYQAFLAGEKLEFEQQIGIERLRRYSCRDYPGWNMNIPDVVRMDRFLKEFREFTANDGLPNFCIVYLPQDHFGGGVVSRSHMADNDLALGRLVEAVSHSKYWKDTVIFVNEDDPQNGYDHIDGHRSLCLVISAYSRAGVNHSFYNQTSVLRTMLHLFGLSPLNQQDASMPLMRDCFQASGDFSSYDAIPANFPLDELPPPQEQQSATEKLWRQRLATVPIERTGMKTAQDEDHLNRFVWHEMRGWTTPYPAAWAGGHARGLPQLGLRIDVDVED